jgi:hypothetical protein
VHWYRNLAELPVIVAGHEEDVETLTQYRSLSSGCAAIILRCVPLARFQAPPHSGLMRLAY